MVGKANCFGLCVYAFVNVLMGSMFGFYQYKDHKSSQNLHTGPLNNEVNFRFFKRKEVIA